MPVWLVLCLEVIDDEGNIVPQETEGNLAIRVKPYKPFSLFTEYTVITAWAIIR